MFQKLNAFKFQQSDQTIQKISFVYLRFFVSLFSIINTPIHRIIKYQWKYANLIFISLMITVPAISFAQVKPTDPDIIQQQLLENASQSSGEDVDLTELEEQRLFYSTHPLDLNNSSIEELVESGLFNALQVQELFIHLRKYGKLISLEELQTIDGFDLLSIRTLKPYIIVKAEPDLLRRGFSSIIKDGQQEITLRMQEVLEDQKGFSPKEKPTDTRYAGSPIKFYSRYRFTFGNQISAGITGEKDAGEEFFKGSQKNGFDFYSAHLFIKDKSLKALAIGDYQLKYGQGLLIWSGLATGKNSDVINIKRNNIGIRPYTSVNEFSYLRGGAISYGIKQFTIDAFYSYRKLDASTLLVDSLNDETLVTAFVQDGYHRTQSELDKKNILKNELFGGHLNYRITGFEVGLTAFNTHYGASLEKNDKPYNQFDPSGKEFTGASINYNYNFRNLLFFGETARSSNNAYATLNGLLISLDPRASFSILYRNYARNYECIYCNSFRESDNANERGIYMGLAINPTKSINLNSYVDFFKFPWLRYQVDAPSEGIEWLSQLTWTPSKTTSFYLRYKEQQKQENQASSSKIDGLVVARQRNIRINAACKISSSISIQSRLEFNSRKIDHISTANGVVFFQDIQYNKLGSPVSFSIRYVNFDTDNYDTRIYAYENDIPGVFSIPSYYYQGRRVYFLVKYHFARGIDFWVRYGTTYYDNKEEVGSGYDVIAKNHKSELKLQLRIGF